MAGEEPIGPYVNRSIVLILSTGHSYRIFHITAPTKAGQKPAVHYGGELLLPVLHYATNVFVPGGIPHTTNGAPETQAEVDREQVLLVMCMLALAGTGALKPEPIAPSEAAEFWDRKY